MRSRRKKLGILLAVLFVAFVFTGRLALAVDDVVVDEPPVEDHPVEDEEEHAVNEEENEEAMSSHEITQEEEEIEKTIVKTYRDVTPYQNGPIISPCWWWIILSNENQENHKSTNAKTKSTETKVPGWILLKVTPNNFTVIVLLGKNVTEKINVLQVANSTIHTLFKEPYPKLLNASATSRNITLVLGYPIKKTTRFGVEYSAKFSKNFSLIPAQAKITYSSLLYDPDSRVSSGVLQVRYLNTTALLHTNASLIVLSPNLAVIKSNVPSLITGGIAVVGNDITEAYGADRILLQNGGRLIIPANSTIVKMKGYTIIKIPTHGNFNLTMKLVKGTVLVTHKNPTKSLSPQGTTIHGRVNNSWATNKLVIIVILFMLLVTAIAFIALVISLMRKP